jgi:hypothetical protein
MTGRVGVRGSPGPAGDRGPPGDAGPQGDLTDAQLPAPLLLYLCIQQQQQQQEQLPVCPSHMVTAAAAAADTHDGPRPADLATENVHLPAAEGATASVGFVYGSSIHGYGIAGAHGGSSSSKVETTPVLCLHHCAGLSASSRGVLLNRTCSLPGSGGPPPLPPPCSP